MRKTGPEFLPPFSGDDSVCDKCMYIGASTTYMAHGRCTHDMMNDVIGHEPNERLHRSCRRCDYSWDEALAVADNRPGIIRIPIKDLDAHVSGHHGSWCSEIHAAEKRISK